jgi:hypothetical protein
MWQRYASLFWEAYVCGNLKNGMRLAINTVIDQEFYLIIQGLSEGRQHLTPKWVFAPWKFKQLSRKMNHLEQVNGFSSCKQYQMIRHLVLQHLAELGIQPPSIIQSVYNDYYVLSMVMLLQMSNKFHQSPLQYHTYSIVREAKKLVKVVISLNLSINPP